MIAYLVLIVLVAAAVDTLRHLPVVLHRDQRPAPRRR